jgi:hypothetical protein
MLSATTSGDNKSLKQFILLLGIATCVALVHPLHANSEGLSFEELRIYHEQTLIRKENEKQREENRLSQELVARANALKGRKGGQCVVFVRQFTGVARSQVAGMAKFVKTNSSAPQIGSIVKTKESRYGHVAVVVAITEEQILVVESNYSWNQRISMRWISKQSSKIVGYLQI